MAYIHYGSMSEELIRLAESKLPEWMLEVNRQVSERVQ